MHRLDPPEAAPTIRTPEVTLEMIERIRDGDTVAWESLHERYRDVLKRLARGRLTGDIRRRLDTDDLVQSTFIAAHAGLARFEHRGPGSLQAWLRQILANRLRQRQREHLSDRRDARRHADADSLEGEHDTSVLSPGEAILAAEDHLRYAQALSELPARDQEVLVATQIDGKSVAAVATDMGLSVATIRRSRAQAIATLTKKLG